MSIDRAELPVSESNGVDLTQHERRQLHDLGWLSLSVATENLDSFLAAMLELANLLGRVIGSQKTSRGGESFWCHALCQTLFCRAS